jgi:TPP-dependent pyruvate/acetoin dehydrogenase alpha subunit
MTERKREYPEDVFALYRTMASIRAFETEARRLHLGGRIPGLLHLYVGQEAVAAGVCGVLAKTDYIASHHRGHGHCIAKGGDPEQLFAELAGRRSRYGHGRGGSLHIYDPENGNLGTNGIVGGGVPLATGAALTSRLHKEDRVAVTFFGDGALNQGLVFECLNISALWKLPVIFVCENNRYGEFTAIEDAAAGSDLKARASVFGIPAIDVDGMDPMAIREATIKAVARASAGDGPSFLMCETYRFGGHHVGDKQEYKSSEEREEWDRRDPIRRFAIRLRNEFSASAEMIESIDSSVKAEIRAASQRALEMPFPDPAELDSDVYAD